VFILWLDPTGLKFCLTCFSIRRFDELKNINEKTPEKKVLAALKKAQQCINLG